MKPTLIAIMLLAPCWAYAQPFQVTNEVCRKSLGTPTCPSKLVCNPTKSAKVWADGKIDTYPSWYEYFVFDLKNERYGAGETPDEKSVNTGPLKFTGTVPDVDTKEKHGSLQYATYHSDTGELRFVGAISRDKIGFRISATVIHTSYTDAVSVVHSKCIPTD